jgi:hypothetical protein
MIKDSALWEAWEREQERTQPVDEERNFALFEVMYQHARSFDTFLRSDPLEGIEVKIRIAQALNVRPPSPTDRNQS